MASGFARLLTSTVTVMKFNAKLIPNSSRAKPWSLPGHAMAMAAVVGWDLHCTRTYAYFPCVFYFLARAKQVALLLLADI